MSRCIAYKDDGTVCGAVATYVDTQRNGLVCEAHAGPEPANIRDRIIKRRIIYLAGVLLSSCCKMPMKMAGSGYYRCTNCRRKGKA